MQYCSRCVYPAVAVNLIFDEEGVCSACRVAEEYNAISDEEWQRRFQLLKELVDRYRSKDGSNYDCVVPFGGGKDSYFQAHVAKNILGLNPLLVTYHGNNYLPEGQRNLDRARDVLGCDHIVYRPSVKTLIKLNRVGFKKMGDMNWHAHCGINTVPFHIAVKYRIPLVIWGEVGWAELAGMFSPDDFVEYSQRTRVEHNLHGYDWYDMLDEEEGVSVQDLQMYRFPTDEEYAEVGIRGIALGNYIKWDANKQAKLMKELYGHEWASKPFERTYRLFSNLDDRYENGVHDLLKFIKFGYGRASDHASKDIRAGYMTREQGIEMVRKYDHVVSSDLYYWLDYVNMTEEEFWRIADTFRDPRVWRIENGQWVKDNIWGEPAAYGPVRSDLIDVNKYK
ncbi:MAG: N-acetyl sugar amidotransferase [Calditrichaeota bacterium]|nr:MAG: N-acetyl sugar amidotransferase [Calditrichota bacterium]